MMTITYAGRNSIYVNMTNRCPCACVFCLRHNKDHVFDADSLWLEREPTVKEICDSIDAWDLEKYDEIVFCGYGEPTERIELLVQVADYVRSVSDIKIRINTNGLGNLYHKRNIIPELAKVVDCVSISLNAPTAEKYEKVTRPQFENAFPAMLDFASLAQETFEHTQLSIVDVLPKEEIEACQKIADDRGIYLKIRKFS